MNKTKLNELQRDVIKKYSDYLKASIEAKSKTEIKEKKKIWEDSEDNLYEKVLIYENDKLIKSRKN